MNIISLSKQPIEVEHAVSNLSDPHAGGLAVFVGITRQWTEGRETVRLEYDAYPAMAEREIERLINSAAQRWAILHVCVLHRLGIVGIKEPSVLIGVAAAHRADAFAACQFLIDELKQSVPIWKREVYADGEEVWI